MVRFGRANRKLTATLRDKLMIISFEELQTLPQQTVDNVIKEYIYQQVEDGNVDSLNASSTETMMQIIYNKLKKKELAVEYSEEHQSVAIISLIDKIR